MRRWVCVIALLFGFAGDGYAWTARPRIPVPIERQIVDEPLTRWQPSGRWSLSGRWWQSA